MGCSTTGFVMTKEKDPFKIWRNIKWTIFEEIKRETGIDDVRAVWGKNYTMPRCLISDFSGHMVVSFKFAGEDRDMHINLSCDNDYSYVRKGEKIILSLGTWGRSVQLMECVLRGLSTFGQAYIAEDDCKEDWRQLS
jgi:hypothetical protein